MFERVVFLAVVLVSGGLAPLQASADPACPAGALGTSRALAVGTQGGTAVGLKSYPRTLPLGDHEVALTFDDGPDAATTPAILDALKHECAKAAFFLIGRNAQALPALARREVAEQHTVGHHTFSHPAITLRRMSTAEAETDIERGFQADDIAAYGSASDAPRVPFFRYPGFADAPEVNRWLARRDIAIFGADLWASDWLLMTPQAELKLVMERLARTKGGILLLHDSRSSTARMLPALLRALKSEGYRLVQLVPGEGKTEIRPASTGWTSETDRVIEEVFRREDLRLHRSSSKSDIAMPVDGPSALK